MRDYLFRGVDKTTGKWVYGGYTLDAIDNPRITTKDDSGEGMLFHEVIPETVGMWSGMVDKHGNKIWESDICLVTKTTYTRKYLQTDDMTSKQNFVCKCVFEKAQFILLHEYEDRGRIKKNVFGLSDCVVIGNIFEDKELLEAQ